MLRPLGGENLISNEPLKSNLGFLEALRKPGLAKSMIWGTVGAYFPSEGARTCRWKDSIGSRIPRI